jgi:hypothetical protein
MRVKEHTLQFEAFRRVAEHQRIGNGNGEETHSQAQRHEAGHETVRPEHCIVVMQRNRLPVRTESSKKERK